MCFKGILYCDSLIITAPASTFAWWIGFLMNAEWNRTPSLLNGTRKRIFFNADLKRNTPRNTYDRTNFLPEWIPIRLHDSGEMRLEFLPKTRKNFQT